MNLSKAEMPVFGLALACIAVVAILLMTNHGVPEYLWIVLSALLAGGLGITVPTSPTAALPAEVEGLVSDLRKMFATVTETTPAAPAPTKPAAPIVTHTTSVSAVQP